MNFTIKFSGLEIILTPIQIGVIKKLSINEDGFLILSSDESIALNKLKELGLAIVYFNPTKNDTVFLTPDGVIALNQIAEFEDSESNDDY